MSPGIPLFLGLWRKGIVIVGVCLERFQRHLDRGGWCRKGCLFVNGLTDSFTIAAHPGITTEQHYIAHDEGFFLPLPLCSKFPYPTRRPDSPLRKLGIVIMVVIDHAKEESPLPSLWIMGRDLVRLLQIGIEPEDRLHLRTPFRTSMI